MGEQGLYHRRQAALYGCIYHALYALDGDESWLVHTDDISHMRWLGRLHERGLVAMTYFADAVTDATCTPEFWAALRGAFDGVPGEFSHVPLLVTIAGRSGLGRHTVALALPVEESDFVQVSDSATASLLELGYGDFLAGEYAAAHEVFALSPADLERHPYQSGAEYVSRADPAPYQM